jgi:hypothetical protein
MGSINWSEPAFFVLLILTILWFGYLLGNHRRMEATIGILIDRLREVGVKADVDTETGAVRCAYTAAARELLAEHFYPSAWNLERQLDWERFEQEQAERRQVVDRLVP